MRTPAGKVTPVNSDRVSGGGILAGMDRAAILLQGLDPATQIGIEIGALDRPVVPPSERVFYVDHMDTPSLIQKYKDDPGVRLDKIVEVRGVWGASTLAEIAKPVAPVDFIVASHVIEHVPDLISWLGELSSVLKPGGQIRLAIPDRRYTFDILRRTTDLPEVLGAYAMKARAPVPAQVADFLLHFTEVDCGELWRGGTVNPQQFKRGADPRDMLRLTMEAAAGQYHDVHSWVFTPQSFAELMEDLSRAGLIRLRCSQFVDTLPDTFEFFAGLQACSDSAEATESWGRLAADLREKQRAIEARPVEELKAEVKQLQESLEAMRNTLSWRVTAPLRSVRSLFRRQAR